MVFKDVTFILHFVKFRLDHQNFKGGGEIGTEKHHHEFISPLQLLGTETGWFVSEYKEKVNSKDQV
jgi:hypothetical protein